MKIESLIWKEEIIEKLATKHQVDTEEVEEVFNSKPILKLVEKGNVKGENLYAAYGQTDAGRYIIVFFIYKPSNAALPISARDMMDRERKYYEQRK